MNTKKNNNGSPVGKPTGRDNNDNVILTAPSKASKSWFTLDRVMDMAVNENWTAPYSPPTESLPKHQRVKTVYRVTKNGTTMTKIIEEV
jgi:hypothetical protein